MGMALAGLVLAGTGSALAYRIADLTAWTGTLGNATSGGGTASATVEGGSGLTVSATAGANNFLGIGTASSGSGGVLSSTLLVAQAGAQSSWYTPQFSTGSFGFRSSLSGRTTWQAGNGNAGSDDTNCRPTSGTAGASVTCHPSTLTFTFEHPVTNPVLHLSGIGGFYEDNIGGTTADDVRFNIWSQYQVTTPGATLTLLSSNGQLVLSGGNTINHPNSVPTQIIRGSCSTAGAGEVTAGCGSVRVNGTFSTLTFTVSLRVARQLANTNQPNDNEGAFFDGVHTLITLPEDYGDAPASYESGDAATHVLTDLKLGATVTEDNAGTLNSGSIASSPIASATASGDGGDDGAVFPSTIPRLSGAVTTVPVTISGASKAGVVCGWIDYNRDGDFADTGERSVCQSFAAGAAGANLVFTAPAASSSGASFARVRISYDGNFTVAGASPTGSLDSGETEDYAVTLAPPQADLSLTKTNTPGQNGEVDQTADTVTRGAISTYAIIVRNVGPDAADNAVLRDPAPTGLNCTAVSCTVSGGSAICPTAPALSIANLQAGGVPLATMPAGGSLTFNVTCQVQ